MILIFLAFFIQFFTLDFDSTGLQIVPVLILIIEALRCIPKIIRDDLWGEYLSLNFSFLFFALFLPLYSMLLSLFSGSSSIFLYSIVYLFVALALIVIVIGNGIELIVEAFVFSAVCFFGVLLVTASGELLAAYQSESINIGINRLNAYGIHPNLYGHIYSGVLVASIWLAHYRKGLYIFLGWTGVAISLFVISAASSRGGLISGLCGAGYVYYCHGRSAQKSASDPMSKIRRLTNFFVAILGGFFLSKFILNSLDLESSDRGVDSGFSGRASNWSDLWATITDTVYSLLFGGGFRSYDPLINNVHTDNSYINFGLEFGVPLLFVFVVLILFRFKYLIADRSRPLQVLLAGIYACIIVEGLVARYTLGIGNPFSLLILALLMVNLQALKKYDV